MNAVHPRFFIIPILSLRRRNNKSFFSKTAHINVPESKKGAWRLNTKTHSGRIVGGAALLCIFGLATKGLGMIFRVYLSNRIGTEGMGLYQLVMSVYALFTTFSTAGLTVSVSRLTGEALGMNNPDNACLAARRFKNTGIAFALLLGAVSLTVMFTASRFTAQYLLSDMRTVLPMKILSVSMPFMAVAACYKGYWIASHRVIITASAQLLEQLVKIAVTYFFFASYLSVTTDIGKLTTRITIGLSAGEAFSTLYFIVFDVFSKKHRFPDGEKRFCPLSRITGIVLPIGASAYVTGILHTIESVLIPFCFSLYGGDRAAGLADFGLIRGMVIPALFFPFAFLSALVSMLIPEISRLSGERDRRARDSKICKAMRFAFAFGIAAGGLFFFLPREVGTVFYNSPEAERPLRILAAVTPFMYVETVCDGLLKSIGEQVFTLKTGVINSVSRIILLLFVIPSVGAEGYLWLLVTSNTFSFAMCYFRLRRCASLSIGFISYFIVPIAAAGAGGIAARLIIDSAHLEGIAALAAGGIIYLALFAAIFAPVCRYGSRKAL